MIKFVASSFPSPVQSSGVADRTRRTGCCCNRRQRTHPYDHDPSHKYRKSFLQLWIEAGKNPPPVLKTSDRCVAPSGRAYYSLSTPRSQSVIHNRQVILQQKMAKYFMTSWSRPAYGNRRHGRAISSTRLVLVGATIYGGARLRTWPQDAFSGSGSRTPIIIHKFEGQLSYLPKRRRGNSLKFGRLDSCQKYCLHTGHSDSSPRFEIAIHGLFIDYTGACLSMVVYRLRGFGLRSLLKRI